MPPFFEVGKSKSDWLDQRSGRTRNGGAAERMGQLAPGGTIIRSDAGNNGTGNPLVAAAKGLPHNSRYTGQDVGGKDRRTSALSAPKSG